jgi:hypothetical protein
MALSDLKEYADAYPGVPVFFFQDTPKFIVAAGKVSWSGTFEKKAEVEAMERWLEQKAAKRVRGWRDLAEIFA